MSTEPGRGGSAVYPANAKDSPTTPPSQQQTFESRLDARRLSLSDFDLPGLGEPGEVCGTNRMPEKNAVCPNGDAVRYEPNRCRRVSCPDCYQSEDREQAFKIAVELEAAARVRGERPHEVIFSTPKEESRRYSIDDINGMMKRGYRRAKRQMGVLGGYGFVHPARLKKSAQQQLRADGYGDGSGSGPGLWAGVREDALGRGDWREYAYYSPHGHNIGFPGFIEPHEGDDFIIRKLYQLEGVENVVRRVRYNMSHRGTFGGDGTFRAIRPWGMMHHAANGWDGAEEELSADAYATLCEEIAEIMGGEWNESEGLHYPDERAKCPECGTPKRDFIDLHNLPGLASTKNQGGAEWINRLSPSQRRFFREIIDILCREDAPRLYEGDIPHPDDVAIWVDGDGDRPPPG